MLLLLLMLFLILILLLLLLLLLHSLTYAVSVVLLPPLLLLVLLLMLVYFAGQLVRVISQSVCRSCVAPVRTNQPHTTHTTKQPNNQTTTFYLFGWGTSGRQPNVVPT